MPKLAWSSIRPLSVGGVLFTPEEEAEDGTITAGAGGGTGEAMLGLPVDVSF